MLHQLANEVDIEASDKTFRNLVKKWSETGRFDDEKSNTRKINNTKINRRQLISVDSLVQRRQGISSRSASDLIPGLHVTASTIRRYLRKLGWKVIRTKYCQYVSLKNQIERYIYAHICLLTSERFLNFIFVDECTVQLCQHGSSYRYKKRPDKIALIGKYKHEASVHVIGGISRKGRTKLYY